MKKKQKAGHKAKKRLPADTQSAQGGSRAKTADRNEVRRVTTHRQGHPK